MGCANAIDPPSRSTMPASTALRERRVDRRAFERRLQQLHGGTRTRRGVEEQLLRERRKGPHAIADEVVAKVPRDRQGLARRAGVAAEHRARDLQREERVPARCLVHAVQDRRREARVEARAHQLGELVDRSAARSTAVRHASSGNARPSPSGSVVAEPRTASSQPIGSSVSRRSANAKCLRRSSDRAIGRRRSRRTPDPARRRLPEDRQRRRVHRSRVGGRPDGLGAEERDLERGPAAEREAARRGHATPSNRSARPANASVASDSAGRIDDTRQPRPSGSRHAAIPERRLPHPRPALQHERGRPVHQLVEERVEPGELVDPPDDVVPTLGASGVIADRPCSPPGHAGQTPPIRGLSRVLQPCHAGRSSGGHRACGPSDRGGHRPRRDGGGLPRPPSAAGTPVALKVLDPALASGRGVPGAIHTRHAEPPPRSTIRTSSPCTTPEKPTASSTSPCDTSTGPTSDGSWRSEGRSRLRSRSRS